MSFPRGHKYYREPDTFWNHPLVFALVCIVSCIMMFVIVKGIESIPQRIHCANAYDGVQTRYKTFGGCQVHVGNMWVPEDSFRPTN